MFNHDIGIQLWQRPKLPCNITGPCAPVALLIGKTLIIVSGVSDAAVGNEMVPEQVGGISGAGYSCLREVKKRRLIQRQIMKEATDVG